MWFFYALGSAFFSAMMAVLGKLGLKNIEPLKGVTLGSTVIFFIFFLITFFTEGLNFFKNWDWSLLDWGLFTGSVVCGALSWLLYFYAIKTGSPASVLAVTMSSLIFVVIFSNLFLNEVITTQTFVGALFMVAGAFLIVMR